jgi:hypothetical protein
MGSSNHLQCRYHIRYHIRHIRYNVNFAESKKVVGTQYTTLEYLKNYVPDLMNTKSAWYICLKINKTNFFNNSIIFVGLCSVWGFFFRHLVTKILLFLFVLHFLHLWTYVLEIFHAAKKLLAIIKNGWIFRCDTRETMNQPIVGPPSPK